MSNRIRSFGGDAGMLWRKKSRIRPANHSSVEAPFAADPSSFSNNLAATNGCATSKHATSASKDENECNHGCPTMATPKDSTRAKGNVSDESPSYPVILESPSPMLSPSPFMIGRPTLPTTGHSVLKSWKRPHQDLKQKHFGTKRRWVTVERPQDAVEYAAMHIHLETVKEPSELIIEADADALADEEKHSLSISRAKTRVTLLQSSDTNLDSTNELQCLRDSFTVNDNDRAINVQQPGSTTSLAVAQRFFKQLDSEHPLTMTESLASNHSERAKFNDGRTCRTMTLREPGIKQDYEAYSAMCVNAGVDPLSVGAFLEQCAMTRKYVYDGFLDE
ncbi:hypothetical protein MPSEU_000703200 [Mayamaea pseudoterrestris]|nr:hypothetical protein MPSEU_000703200 [Mayamaea pseudoterrestris]